MQWGGKRVFVTGADGFIGSHLAEELVRRGARVKALALYNSMGTRGWLDASEPGLRDAMEIVSGDVRDGEQMRRAVRGSEVIFHLAALIGIPYSYTAPRSYIESNVIGTLNVLEAARDGEGVRVVHTSTSEVYGSARRVPIDESHPLQPQSPYSASKVAADALVESFALSFGLDTVTVRPFNTYGPRQSARAVIPTVLSQLLAGKRLRLGALTPVRDFTFVSDTVNGFLALGASARARGRVLNLGTGTGVSIAELVRLAAELSGREPVIEEEVERLRPPASEVDRLIADPRLASELGGWRAQIELAQGLALTAEWIAANPDRFAPARYAV